MPSQLVISGDSYDSSSDSFIVRLPNTNTFKNTSMACAQVTLFNSFGNVSAELGNNVVKYYFPSGAGHLEYVWTLPSGYYTASRFNTWFKSQCDDNYLYTENAVSGVRTYYSFMGSNQSYQTLIMHTQLSESAVVPHEDALWVSPTDTLEPAFDFVTSGLARLFGYSNTEVGNGTGTGSSYYSDSVPQLNSVQSLVITTNLISDQLSFPSNLLAQMPVAGREFGANITRVWGELEYNSITPGNYNEIVVQFRDQNLRRVRLLDTNILILLSFLNE
jgi:hypothetical protein